jgi:hypothetical protein
MLGKKIREYGQILYVVWMDRKWKGKKEEK